MGQQYGAAQPIVDFFRGGKKKKPEPKPDTSWHDEQVRKANESFSKPSKAAANPKLGTKKKAMAKKRFKKSAKRG